MANNQPVRFIRRRAVPKPKSLLTRWHNMIEVYTDDPVDFNTVTCLFSSTLVYVKLLLLWALVLLADHFLEFRFEYLWPFWLFLRSVYDSFKYQGLVSLYTECQDEWISPTNHTLPITGILRVFRLHCSDLRHDLLLVYTGPLAFLRCQYLRVGTIRLAYG